MMQTNNNLKFIVDENVGKLVRWLRLLGFDTLRFNGASDTQMVAIAMAAERVILTRDTHILERRLVTRGRVRVILIQSDIASLQVRQVVDELRLDKTQFYPFSRCLEDNSLLEDRTRSEVSARVPPFVFKTQEQYKECPACRRIYWRGTHWQAMMRQLDAITE